MDKPKITAKDFFLHVAILATLYVSVVNVIVLLVQTINVAFPDVLEQGYYYNYQGYTGGMRFAVASLVIIFPVFILLSWWNHRQIARSPELRELAIRKWFTYLTLFLAGATIIGDLIAFLNTFLGGEITMRFVLKVLAILLVTAFVFVYNLYELRGTGAKNTYRIFRFLAIVVALGAIIWSFFVMGSPIAQRDIRLDERRVSDLQNIQYQVINFWQYKQKLPATLNELSDPISGFILPKDPVSGESYEYRATNPLGFELCATFAKPNVINPNTATAYPRAMEPVPAMPYGVKGVESNWKHSIGRVCFSRTIDPQLYPPYKSIPATPIR